MILEGFGVENFRVFEEKTWFDFKPITLLIGANNTGKSSLTKALYLFKDATKTKKLDFDSHESILQLGGFERVLNWNLEKSVQSYISFYLPIVIKHYPSIAQNTKGQLQISFFDKKEGKDSIPEYRNLIISDKNIITSTPRRITCDFGSLFAGMKSIPEDLILDSIGSRIYYGSKLHFENIKRSFQNIVKKGKEAEDENNGVDLTPNGTFRTFYSKKALGNIKILTESLHDFYKNPPDINEPKDLDLFGPIGQSFVDLKSSFMDDIFLKYDIKLSEEEIAREKELEKDSSNEIIKIEKPITNYLEKMGLNSFLIQFLLDEVFGSTFESIGDSPKRKGKQFSPVILSNDIIYHRGIEGRVKRIYTNDNEDNLKLILKNYFKNQTEKSNEFIKKWSSLEGFDLIGEIAPIIDRKNAFHSIDIGKVPIIEQGTGISQITSLILDIASYEKKIIIVEEPEANLHPSYQSKLADFFADAQKTFGHQFIIETHSEYLIRKMQYLIAKNEFDSEDANIYNFRKAVEGEKEIVKQIKFNKIGGLSDNFYPGFYDESDNLAISLFNLTSSKN